MTRLTALLKPSSFKIGCLVILAAVLLFYSFGTRKPDLLAALDNRVVNTMFHWRGAEPTSGQVVIVDVDEKSLSKVGQWPWPRNTVAQLVANLGQGGAKVIGFDIVFAEPDRTSPRLFLDKLKGRLPAALIGDDQTELDHDLILGRTLAELPTVLGYIFQTTNDGLRHEPPATPFPATLIRLDPPEAKFEELALNQAYRAILNVEAVSQAESEGYFNVFPDIDGTVRKVPLFMSLDGMPYPSLALEMTRLGLGEPGLIIHAADNEFSSFRGILGVSLGQRFIISDEMGQTTVNFRGPAFTFPYISAVDVLEGRNLEEVRDKYVLIGTSAAGLLDLRSTPFANVYPGVEVHANLIDNLLAGDPLAHDIFTEIGITYLLIILGGLMLTALLAFGNALLGGIGALLLVTASIVGNYHFFFRQNEIIGLVYPLATLLVIFMVVTLCNYFFEGRKKKAISKAFGQYVPPELVEEMAAKPDELGLGGETREMTVLFSDVRGFTTISEGLEATELTHLMNEMLTPMTRIIHQHRGTIDKYMGDAIMAFWGAPLHDPNHARHALEAGLAMVAAIPRLQEEFAARGWPPIKIGVGLNSGPMNVGNMGSEFRMAYTVLGDAVNLGSRLEGLTKQYGVDIMVSEYTKAQVPDFSFRQLDLVRVKGKDHPVAIFEPLGPAAELDPKTAERLVRHHQALELYRRQEFTAAGEIFNALHQEEPKRLLYGIYLDRISHFQETPPPPDWDGAFTHTSK